MIRPRARTGEFSPEVHRRALRGYSLLELLVVISIMSLMLALLGGTLGRVREAARSFECKNKLKSVAFEFFQLADNFSSSPVRRRRPDQPEQSDRSFYIDDFQEQLYQVDQFWGSRPETEAPYDPARQLLMCPSGPRRLERRANLPCEKYPVTPVENVSVAFNMRLRSASEPVAGRWVLKPVLLNSRILRQPTMPLAFDVEGVVARDRGIQPYYSAPAAGDRGLYGSGLFWFPSLRHGSTNACFVGGHVLSSTRPDRAGWNWKYQPEPE